MDFMRTHFGVMRKQSRPDIRRHSSCLDFLTLYRRFLAAFTGSLFRTEDLVRRLLRCRSLVLHLLAHVFDGPGLFFHLCRQRVESRL